MLRRLFRSLPDTPRALLLQARLHARDALAGGARYATPASAHALPERLRWTQAIHETATADAKRHNLRIAGESLHRTVVQPGDVFSFARIVGPPIAPRGYRTGRTLVGGELAASIGGGLCQLSGLLYLAALECGLDILERHPHSLDIYTDATRFAPLGADATVVYGHRDLRFRNALDAPIGFRCTVEAHAVALQLCCDAAVARRVASFETRAVDAQRSEVTTVVDGRPVAVSVYLHTAR